MSALQVRLQDSQTDPFRSVEHFRSMIRDRLWRRLASFVLDCPFWSRNNLIRLASHESQLRRFMDRSYKEDIPKTKRALEELKKEFSGVASTTDWARLRIEPLLDHVKSLERLLLSPKFARETARLRRGVVMFHSDLVYLRENVRALKQILDVERRSRRRRSVGRAPRR
jgi:hypothetical protein